MRKLPAIILNPYIMRLLGGVVLMILLGAGCKPDRGVEIVQGPTLVESKLIGEYPVAEIRNRFGNNPLITAALQYDLRVYRLVYNTLGVDGAAIQASGALLVPISPDSLPLLSHQHGTITEDRSAPSHYGQGSEAWTAGSVMAASGYVVAAPDYVGYGASADLPHPYEHAASLATASADMLRAAREFCAQNGVQLDRRLFLTGYSEGGFATMALHRHIETNLASEFTVTASAPGAGAYHKTGFARYIIDNEQPLPFINSYLWVLQTYNRVYNLNRPWSFFLTEPHASQVERHGVWTQVSQSPQSLFNQSFREGVRQGTDAAFLAALRHNDIYDWAPRAPVTLFHGTADDYVPIFNSEDAYRAMQARGATQVQLHRIQGGNHGSSIPPFIIGTVGFFNSISE